MLHGEQIRAARALARIEQASLAAASGVSLPTIKRLEKVVGPISANTGTEAAIRKAFDGTALDSPARDGTPRNIKAVLFIDADAQGPGVRLRDGNA